MTANAELKLQITDHDQVLSAVELMSTKAALTALTSVMAEMIMTCEPNEQDDVLSAVQANLIAEVVRGSAAKSGGA